MGLNLTGVFSDIGNLAGSVTGQDVLGGLLTSAVGTVVVSGLGTSAGQNALDPLHIFHAPAAPATATAPGNATASAGVVQGQVMTMTKFLSLTSDQQKMLQAMGYTIIPG